jgi:hypothetical protein
MQEANATRGADVQRMATLGDAVDQVGIGSGVDQGGTGSQTSRLTARPVWCEPQLHTYQGVVTAVFPNAQQAEAALSALQLAGVVADQVGLAARGEALTRTTGLLAVSTAEQELFDALVELGLPGDAARLYQQSFDAGQAILAARTAGHHVDLVSVLQRSVGATATQPIDAQPLGRQVADRLPETPVRGSRSAGTQRASGRARTSRADTPR